MIRRFLFLIFILGGLIFSGCLREYDNVVITSVDVMSSPGNDGTKLTITLYIQNYQSADTGLLTTEVKVREPSTNLIVAEKDLDIGYIKGKSGDSSSVDLTVSNPGEYTIEVQLLEGGKILSQNYAPVIVKTKPGPGKPAEIKLTNMNLVITKIYNGAALVDVSPGIYNQGGESKPLTIEVTARVDPYTAYTKTDELGIVKGLERIRGKVNFDIPRNKEYSFTVSVTENGKIVANGRVNEKIKPNEIKINTPTTFVIMEEGKPIPVAVPAAAKTPKEPGFEIVTALIGILLIYGVSTIIRIKR